MSFVEDLENMKPSVDKLPMELIEKHKDNFPPGTEIIPPQQYTLPPNIMGIPDGIEDRFQREDAEQLIDIFTKYLSKPIIKDGFTNHTQRRTWRKEKLSSIPPEERDEFNSALAANKLKRNSLALIYSVVQLARSDDLLPEELTEPIINLFDEKINERRDGTHRDEHDRQAPITIDPWEDTAVADKIEIIGQVDQYILKILNYLASAK